jgi:translin
LLSRSELAGLQQHLTDYDKARERLLDLTRKTTRLAGWSIIQIHRGQIPKAKATLTEAEACIAQTRDLLNQRVEFKQAGYVIVAFQEFSEAKILLGYASHKKLLTPSEVGVDWMPYLLGLLDFLGELRRRTMDQLKAGKLKDAQHAFESMEALFEDLLSLDRTSIVPTFRRKLDVAKRLVEATRSDVIADIRRSSLERTMKSFEKRMR